MNKRFYNKDKERAEVKALVDDWVAKGGKITQCPPGRAKGLTVSRYHLPKDLGLSYHTEEGEIYLSEGSTRKVPIRYD